MKKILLMTLLVGSVFAGDPYQKRFSEIYHKKLWGVENPSGEGSLPRNLETYIHFLNTFFYEKGITSILDLGCGDFSYFQKLDLTHIHYLGVDIVKDLVEVNKRQYASKNIQFMHGNIITMPLPDADLVICKHVLQHLPNEDVSSIIKRLKKFRYCLLVDQCESNMVSNQALPLGKSRPLDLLSSPFNLNANLIGKFYIGGYAHNILLIENEETSSM